MLWPKPRSVRSHPSPFHMTAKEFRSPPGGKELPQLGQAVLGCGPAFLWLLVPPQSLLVSVPNIFMFNNHDGFCVDATPPKKLERNASVQNGWLYFKYETNRAFALFCFILKFVLFYLAFPVFLMNMIKVKMWRMLIQFLKWYPCAIRQLSTLLSFL